MRGKPSRKGPEPQRYPFGGQMLTARQIEKLTGLSDHSIRTRAAKGTPLDAPRKGQAPPKPKAPVETIEQKRDRYVDEVVNASLQPGYIPRLAEQIAAAFDYGVCLATRGKVEGAES